MIIMLKTESDYMRYLEAFNARDYSTLETFFDDDFVLENAGFSVRGKPAFREFYAFFHSYFTEQVTFKGFYPGTEGVVANVLINFTGIKDLTAEILAAEGYPGMTPVAKGDSVSLEFFILYVTNDQGLVTHIKGAVYFPAA